MAMPFDMDMNAFADIASGAYDLDQQILGARNVGSNVAGIYQIGNEDPDLSNVAVIEQTGGEGNRAMIWQSGDSHWAKITQDNEGINNTARLVQIGSGHFANLIQSGGSDNVMMVQMLGQGARINATQVDAVSNVISVVLNSGSQLTVTQTGYGNNFSTVLAPNTVMQVNQSGLVGQ